MADKASLSTYFFSMFSIFLSFNFNQWLAFGGFLLGLLTFVINWYYKHQNFLINKQNAIKKQQESIHHG